MKPWDDQEINAAIYDVLRDDLTPDAALTLGTLGLMMIPGHVAAWQSLFWGIALNNLFDQRLIRAVWNS